jgi:hypothetical protein
MITEFIVFAKSIKLIVTILVVKATESFSLEIIQNLSI